MNYVVYKHTFPNNKVYIGITGQRPEKRWRNGFGYSHNEYLKGAIRKYGWDNIKHEILFDSLTKEQAEQKEIELIAQHKSNQKEFGYNLSSGGECGATGVPKEYVWNKGRSGVYSEEIRKRISDGLKNYYQTHDSTSQTKFIKGQKAWNKGKKTSDETRRKQSKSHKILVGEKAVRSKAVVMLSLDGGILGKYFSAKEAAFRNKFKSNSLILRCCKGKVRTAYGYRWIYGKD